MKYFKPTDIHTKQNTPDCTADEFALELGHIGAAIIHLNGRYPEKGRALNHESLEMVYVLKGEGKVVIEGEEYTLTEGTLFAVEPGEKYYLEGNMDTFVVNTPEFEVSQHEWIEQE